MDPLLVEIGNDEGPAVVFAIGDALGDALARPGRILVRPALGQGAAQVRLTEN